MSTARSFNWGYGVCPSNLHLSSVDFIDMTWDAPNAKETFFWNPQLKGRGLILSQQALQQARYALGTVFSFQIGFVIVCIRCAPSPSSTVSFSSSLSSRSGSPSSPKWWVNNILQIRHQHTRWHITLFPWLTWKQKWCFSKRRMHWNTTCDLMSTEPRG